MKKILIADPCSYRGHVSFNYGIIRAANMFAKCDILVSDRMKAELIYKGVSSDSFLASFSDEWHIAELKKKERHKLIYHLLFRYYFLKVINRIAKIAGNYDAVLLTCLDVYSYAFVSRKIKNAVSIVDHGIGNIAASKVYRYCWKQINNENNLIVLEPFIKQMVEKHGIKNKIYVVRHPLPEAKATTIKDNFVNIFGPSNSNCSYFVTDLINSDIPDGNKITIKSDREYSTDKLRVINGFISNEIYNDLFSKCNYIILPYPKTYNFRISNVLLEGIVSGKKVLLLNNNTLSFYAQIFPEQVFLFSKIDDLWDIITKTRHKSTRVPESRLLEYSDCAISSALKKALENKI